METFKPICLFLIVCFLFSCKKNSDNKQEISVQDFYISSVKSDKISLTYKLSQLGYVETGVVVYKEGSDSTLSNVAAVRNGNVLELSVQRLEPNTSYSLQVYWKTNGEERKSEKKYEVKTLAALSETFNFKIRDTSVIYDKLRNFRMVLEGDQLNNLNLAELKINIDATQVTFGYPKLISGNKYELEVKGKLDSPFYVFNALKIAYQNNEVFFQSISFSSDQPNQDIYSLTYRRELLPKYLGSVYKNNLYYFLDNKVFLWNSADERLVEVGTGKTVGPNQIGSYTAGIEFDDQLFFLPEQVGFLEDPKNDRYAYYTEMNSYSPKNGKWTAYSFKENFYFEGNGFNNPQYFIQNDQLFLIYGLSDNYAPVSNGENKYKIYLFHYNKTIKKFEKVSVPQYSLTNYRFLSVGKQLYAVGLAPVYDQGFELTKTFCVYKVNNQNFELEEIYRAGTKYEPLFFFPKYAIDYNGNILIGVDVDNYYIFDLKSNNLFPIKVPTPLQSNYLGDFFKLNEKLYLGTAVGGMYSKFYEISINYGKS